MDNGHTTSSVNSPELIETDDFEAGKTSWDQPMSVEHDKRDIGSKTRASFETPIASSEESDELKLGEITPYLPPGVDPKLYDEPTSAASDTDIVKESLTPNLDTIKTTDRLSEGSVKVIDSSISKFNQNNISPANFYEQVRNAMETNIENSYNRKLGER